MTADRLIVLSAPSGAGKTTIAREIMRLNPSLRFSVSATTRPKRPAETDGVDYHFLGRDEFRRRVDAEEFVEWEEVYGDYYGTLRVEVERILAAGDGVLFDVDVKGGLSIKRAYPGALLVFIRPPSQEVLLERLQGRHTEDERTIDRRMERVPMEMTLGEAFDRQVVNDDLPEAVRKVDLLVKQHLQKSRTTGGTHGDQTR